MTRRLTFVLVMTLGILAGVALIAWIGSYAEGFFWVAISRSEIKYISIQRGALAFGVEGSAINSPQGQYFWWLDPDEMLDKCGETTSFGTVYLLPKKDSFQLAVDSSQYPWRWQFGNMIEGFIPLWCLVLCFAIIPGLWAFGLFDRPTPPQPPALPNISVLPSDA